MQVLLALLKLCPKLIRQLKKKKAHDIKETNVKVKKTRRKKLLVKYGLKFTG